MDEFTADAFINRDEPIPVVKLEASDDAYGSEDGRGGHEQSKKDRIKKHTTSMRESIWLGGHSEGRPSMQDRLMEKCVSQLFLFLPPD